MHTFVQHKHKAHKYGKHHTHLHAHPTQWSPCSVQGYTLSALQPLASHTGVTVTLPPHKDDTKHMSVYWTRYWSTFHCQHSTQEGGRLEDSTRLQQKGVQLSVSNSHYEMCSWHVPPQVGLCERAVLGRPKAPQKGVAPARSTSSTYPPEPLSPTATTHLPAYLQLVRCLWQSTRGNVARRFSRDRAAIGFNCRSTARATFLACTGSR